MGVSLFYHHLFIYKFVIKCVYIDASSSWSLDMSENSFPLSIRNRSTFKKKTTNIDILFSAIFIKQHHQTFKSKYPVLYLQMLNFNGCYFILYTKHFSINKNQKDNRKLKYRNEKPFEQMLISEQYNSQKCSQSSFSNFI